MQGQQKTKDPGAIAVAAGATQDEKAGAFNRREYNTVAPPATGMSGSLGKSPSAADHDRAILLRQYVAECLSLASHYAEMGVNYTAIGDDAGLEYSLRNFVTLARQAAGTFNDLKPLLRRASSEAEA